MSMAMMSGVEMAVDPCLDLLRSWCQNVFSHASDHRNTALYGRHLRPSLAELLFLCLQSLKLVF
jgi:hypothetical protein